MFRLITEREKTDGFLNMTSFFTPIKEMEIYNPNEIKIIHNDVETVLKINSMIEEQKMPVHHEEALTDLPSPPSAS